VKSVVMGSNRSKISDASGIHDWSVNTYATSKECNRSNNSAVIQCLLRISTAGFRGRAIFFPRFPLTGLCAHSLRERYNSAEAQCVSPCRPARDFLRHRRSFNLAPISMFKPHLTRRVFPLHGSQRTCNLVAEKSFLHFSQVLRKGSSPSIVIFFARPAFRSGGASGIDPRGF